MKRREDRAETSELLGHTGSVYGKPHTAQLRVRSQAVAERIAGKFVSKQHLQAGAFRQGGTPARAQPRPAAARAKVDHARGAASIDRAKDLLLHRSINICPAGDRLKVVGGAVAHRLRTPLLVKNFEKLETSQPL
jgi:hypothetical protein